MGVFKGVILGFICRFFALLFIFFTSFRMTVGVRKILKQVQDDSWANDGGEII